jgi:hypothetical protein
MKRCGMSAIFFLSFVIISMIAIPTLAQPPGWSGDENLAFLMEINDVSIADSNLENPIPIEPSQPTSIFLTYTTGANLTLLSGTFTLSYLGFPLFTQPFSFNKQLDEGDSEDLINDTIDLSSLVAGGNLSLITGTITGSFSFTYELLSQSGNITIADDFVLRIGASGAAAVISVSGLLTLGLTLLSIFSLLLALDEFQMGILAARKIRSAKKAGDVSFFPRPVVLRRKQKKDHETPSDEVLVEHVSSVAGSGWDGKRCPQCRKKWKKEAIECSKCGLDRASAMHVFSDEISQYAPKAFSIVPRKGTITVGKFGKKLKLKPDKSGALAAALTNIGELQTKSVKTPLSKIAFSGITIAGTYWSWMQLLSGATPNLVDIAITTALGLAVSIFIAYFMKWLARVPELGYD